MAAWPGQYSGSLSFTALLPHILRYYAAVFGGRKPIYACGPTLARACSLVDIRMPAWRLALVRRPPSLRKYRRLHGAVAVLFFALDDSGGGWIPRLGRHSLSV